MSLIQSNLQLLKMLVTLLLLTITAVSARNLIAKQQSFPAVKNFDDTQGLETEVPFEENVPEYRDGMNQKILQSAVYHEMLKNSIYDQQRQLQVVSGVTITIDAIPELKFYCGQATQYYQLTITTNPSTNIQYDYAQQNTAPFIPCRRTYVDNIHGLHLIFYTSGQSCKSPESYQPSVQASITQNSVTSASGYQPYSVTLYCYRTPIVLTYPNSNSAPIQSQDVDNFRIFSKLNNQDKTPMKFREIN